MTSPAAEPLNQWASAQDARRLYFNATAIALNGNGALFLGPSGSGKSSLALALMALGAELISDDGVWLDGTQLTRPENAPPLIEARGVGLLNAGPICDTAPLSVVVDLSRSEPDRLPPHRTVTMGIEKAKLILGAGQTTLAPTLFHLLRFGWADL